MMKRLLCLIVLLPSIVQAQLDSLVIVIDPGHGGYESDDRHLIPDPGVDFWESESNFYKALHLEELLEAQGATVHLTRQGNSDPVAHDPSLPARWQLANANNADWFHSIHSNAFNASVNYTIVLLKENISTRQAAFPEAVTMSSHVYNQIRAHIRTGSSGGNVPGYPGVYLDYTFYGGTSGGFNLGVLSGLTMPGELSEGSFHDFFPETRRLMNNDYRRMEAHALTKAFLQYYSAPPYTQGIIAGIQTNAHTGAPLNGTIVKLLPENRIYAGDIFNNGFYMFDSLAAGPHTIVFDSPRFIEDSVDVLVTSGGVHFVDRALSYSYPAVIQTIPTSGDTSIAVGAEISVRFSNPMDTASVRAALSVSPSVNTSLSWSPDLKVLSLAGSPGFNYYTWYTLTIDSMAAGINGYRVDLNGDEIGGDTLTVLFRTEPAIQANALSFGQIRKEDTSKVTLTVVNRASYDINLVDIDHTSPEFQIAATFPVIVTAFDTAAIEVSFHPTSYGSFSDVFVVYSDSGTIAVAVTGSSPVPNIRVPLTLLDFSALPVDSTADRSFWISTSSINELRIDSMYTTTSSYSYSPQLPFPRTVPVMDTLFLTVTFSPQAEGMVYDTLVIVNNSTVSIARIRLRGNGIVSSVEQVTEGVERFELFQNYPNPFNPETTIDFHIAQASFVRLEILDVLGRSVRILADRDFPPGAYRVAWNGRDDNNRVLSSGVYFCRLEAGENVFSKKLILLK